MRTIHPEHFEGYTVPAHTQAALMRYVNQGFMPGGFLTAVITNDLFGAVSRADEMNIQALPEIVKFIYNEIPMAAVGSTEKMDKWCGLVREEKRKTEAVRAAYEAGLCPDCGSDIPDGTDFGDACLNCDHVFAEHQPCDDEE